jgi:hypothetical protein
MAIYDGQLSWQVTGIFLQLAAVMAAGAIFPSFIGSDNRIAQAASGIVISVAGVVLSAMFGSMAMRIRTYAGFWSARARDLESHLTGTGTFTGASMLSTMGQVDLGTSRVKMRTIYGVRTKLMMATFFSLTIATFVGLLALNGVKLMQALP